MDDYIIIKNARIDGCLTDLVTRNGKIVSIGKTSTKSDFIDLGGNRLLPGLIDVHTHGCMGYETMEGHLTEMSRFHKKNGVTTWLPTTMTMPAANILSVTNEIPIQGDDCAEIMGFHMEGPYIAASRKGAQNGKYITDPDVKSFRKFKNIKMVTIAPELNGSSELIKSCANSKDGEGKVVVSLGHTECDYEIAKKAFENGASCLTHTFNAMPALLHRAPGPIGAAITENAYAQVICDGQHIHRAAILALYRIFGVEKMILISDSMRATGLGDGKYMFGGQEITVTGGVARTSNGALAGSTTPLYKCVMKAIEFGISPCDAFRMASATPAELMGWKKGKIEVGYDSSFIILDSEYNLLDTLILRNSLL